MYTCTVYQFVYMLLMYSVSVCTQCTEMQRVVPMNEVHACANLIIALFRIEPAAIDTKVQHFLDVSDLYFVDSNGRL